MATELLLRNRGGKFREVTLAVAKRLGKTQPGEWSIVGIDGDNQQPRHGKHGAGSRPLPAR